MPGMGDAAAARKAGPYTLQSMIGSGGFGETYLGVDSHGSRVAVKLLRPQSDPQLTATERFRRELRASQSLTSHLFARVLDFDLRGPDPWICFSYAEGRDLTELIREGPLAADRLLRIAHQLLTATLDLSAAGIVHRDLKPANIRIGPNDSVTVLDLGIASLPGLETITRGAIGTIAYMAPEQIDGGKPTTAMDVWAIGLIVAQLAGVRHPFGAHFGSLGRLIEAVKNAEPDLSQVPDEWAATVQRCLEKRASSRPTPSQLLNQLESSPSSAKAQRHFRFADISAGIGGLRLGWEAVGAQCVFTSERDEIAKRVYVQNFALQDGHVFAGDLSAVSAESVPDHDVLLAGVPSPRLDISGASQARSAGAAGTLWSDLARIIHAKRPRAFMFENPYTSITHRHGSTLKAMLDVFADRLGYHMQYRVLDASPLVPQTRKRMYVVGFAEQTSFDLSQVEYPLRFPTMRNVLHPEDGSEEAEGPYTEGSLARVSTRYTLSNRVWMAMQDRAGLGTGRGYALIGPDDIAPSLSARYPGGPSDAFVERGAGRNPRRLTPREYARLFGFPDVFRISIPDGHAYRMFGSSAVVPVAAAVARQMRSHLG